MKTHWLSRRVGDGRFSFCGFSGLAVLAVLSFGLLFAQSASAATWINTGQLNLARNAHTTTLLLNGQLLVIGGVANNGNITNSAELYDPATGSCRVTGSMITPRQLHTATLLLNGKVLVAGGLSTN